MVDRVEVGDRDEVNQYPDDEVGRPRGPGTAGVPSPGTSPARTLPSVYPALDRPYSGYHEALPPWEGRMVLLGL